jgi:hypothetical protein
MQYCIKPVLCLLELPIIKSFVRVFVAICYIIFSFYCDF